MISWNTLGFDTAKTYVDRAIAENSLHHSYLFTGQEKIGKRTFALELADKLATSADILEITASDIEAIRGAKQFLSLTAFSSTYKVVIIDNAGSLSEEAQNTLLKILEEPSATSILILITGREDEVLPTIASRCHVMTFPVQSRVIFDLYFADKKLSQNQQDFLYEFSNGSIGLIYGLDDFKQIKNIIEEYAAITKADINQRFTVAQSLAKEEGLEQKILYWMLYLRTKKLYTPLRGLLEVYQTIAHSQYNKQLALENFMLQL